MKKFLTFDSLMQLGLLTFTTVGYFMTSAKLPQYGVAISLFAQVFWLYSSYRAWKEAGQISIFINSLMLTAVFAYGVINYWLL